MHTIGGKNDEEISIHAPLRERRVWGNPEKYMLTLFQSTLPYGSDATPETTLYVVEGISIHAPLRERQARPALP